MATTGDGVRDLHSSEPAALDIQMQTITLDESADSKSRGKVDEKVYMNTVVKYIEMDTWRCSRLA